MDLNLDGPSPDLSPEDHRRIFNPYHFEIGGDVIQVGILSGAIRPEHDCGNNRRKRRIWYGVDEVFCVPELDLPGVQKIVSDLRTILEQEPLAEFIGQFVRKAQEGAKTNPDVQRLVETLTLAGGRSGQLQEMSIGYGAIRLWCTTTADRRFSRDNTPVVVAPPGR